MKLFTVEELRSLLAPQRGHCLSLYMPTHRRSPGNAEDPIRFRNLLREAESLLLQALPAREAEALLQPVSALSGSEFWRYQVDGLAVFRSRDEMTLFRLPMAFPEIAVVADSFHVKPLLRFLHTNRRFHLLALSQRSVALYEGTRTSLGPVDLDALPRSLSQALGLPAAEAGNARAGEKGSAPVLRGPGAPEAARKEDVVRFLRVIDHALWERLREDRIPLVLACPAHYFPIYREITRFSQLAHQGVEGNFDDASPEELHAKAWPVVAQLFRSIEDQALAELARLSDRRLGSDVLTEVAGAALRGRVRRLFLGEGKQLFGRLDAVTGQVTLHGPRQSGPEDDDVLDDLAEAVLARGGEVFVIDQGRMPGDAAAAASFRW